MMTKFIFAAVAAMALAACGEAADQAAELRARAGAAVEEHAVADAVVSAVDLEVAETIAQDVAAQALREALPTEELGAAAAIIDERKLVDGLGQAVDERALGRSMAAAADKALSRPRDAAER